MGPPLGVPPTIHVVLHAGGDVLFAEAAFVGKCTTLEVVEERRVERVTSEVTAFPIVMAAIASGVAMSIYLYPEIDAGESAIAGTSVLATGVTIFGVSKALEHESVRELPPVPAQRVGAPTPCALRPIANELLTVTGAGKTLSAQTDPWGRVTFTEPLAGPYRVTIGNVVVDEVEVRK